jgi:hypothetical protein
LAVPPGRPGTASARPGTASSARPGTAGLGDGGGSGGGTLLLRPGTAARLGVTPQQPLPLQRPGTAASGRLGTAGGGGGRSPAVTAALAALRARISDVSSELGVLREQLDARRREAPSLLALARRRAALSAEVAGLEGALADTNLALDKARSSSGGSGGGTVTPAELAATAAALATRNAAASAEADALFAQRTQREAATARLAAEAAAVAGGLDARVATLPPPLAEEVRALHRERDGLAAAEAAAQAVLGEVTAEVDVARAAVADAEAAREAAAARARRRARLEREAAALAAELAAARSDSDPGRARERLLVRVRADTARLAAADADLAGVRAEADAARAALASVSAQLAARREEVAAGGGGAGGGAGGDDTAAPQAVQPDADESARRYEALFARDAEMSDAIDRLPPAVQREVRRSGGCAGVGAPLRGGAPPQHRPTFSAHPPPSPSPPQTQLQAELTRSIAALEARLAATQRRAAALASLDPAAVATLLAADGGSGAGEPAATTAPTTETDRLRAQLVARHRDFLAAAGLVARLEGEAASLTARMATMTQQAAGFRDLPRARAEAAARHDALVARLRELTQRRDAVQTEVDAADDELAAARARLAADPHAAALAELDASLAAATAQVATLRAGIDAAVHDSDVSAARAAALAAAGEVTQLLGHQPETTAAAVRDEAGAQFGSVT